ncbi:Bicupin, oxalate decarboxylase/oxidase [Aspergillus steynii IBT 23096]|uniref:Bicupin, oxalate decarboxylase/oxidase n=1 Tax=Aspergillus steynii IBT 23096 TaxID=1392250 RepID=A0A2I2GLQ8_9EURO|nr:Bicupin, oxalate decarboxylase/oxidase [Aspergillus steynii IBT 23096]PLB53820.1 Bicupin, oxalate decarboxylase/oxidase [Aspergillus steynii IBT 23096]
MKPTILFHLIAAVPCILGATTGKRSEFEDGQPIDDTGKGASILGGTNPPLDLQNPDNLGRPTTDNGFVPNLKWSFSDSKTKIFPGGWTREQVIQDLPASHDIASAQQHLSKGAIRELHWHRVAEWGFLYAGSLLLSGVDEDGGFTTQKLEQGDIWYFPKGVAHTVQGLDDENEYILVFDDGDFEKVGTTFMISDWITHTPRDILAKNFVVDPSVFDAVPAKFPYILNGSVSSEAKHTPQGTLTGNSSYVYRTYQHPAEPVPGSGGVLRKIDSRNFPVSKTIAASVVELEPRGLRELHWHPNAEEWLYFHRGQARATVFIGDSKARTFDFRAGDTGVFPEDSGHYIENTSDTEKLVWIEIYKSDRVADISLAQWLALTPADVVAQTLKVDVEVVKHIKKEKQVFVPGS